MLQIKNISKKYKTGDLIQVALDDVSLNFRDNEFVSILGPSGSGKTTLLNIVGGLDRYDSGDLIINNVSTKRYKDRDWDSYRNHTIGFVFQSYNLIPHQTVLSNVELALTIGGISKKERRERALQALDEVGLKDQAHKKPNQMSGGQMQRVAIARALVNNPKILLADEPTGALDTVTSVQVMELLKKVAKDRLVIMVTHNPELAEEYSTRIVKLKDGRIIDDSDPFYVKETAKNLPKHKNLGKASMSILTAFSLSFNNLLTKKGRTILTAFAGSIGIIGIALILALSTGFQNYIDQIQEDTLTSYPLTITEDTVDMTSALLSMVSPEEGENEAKSNMVKERQYISTMFTEIGKNDLLTFKKFLEKNQEKVDEMASMVRYQYRVTPLIYTENVNDEITKLNPSSLMTTLSGGTMTTTAVTASSSSIFYEMIDNQEEFKENYDVLAGRWPVNYNELLLVLPESNGMPDLLLYSLGLRDDDELNKMLTKIAEGKKVKDIGEPLEYSYEELLNIPLKLVDATNTYKFNKKYDIYEDMSENEKFMRKAYNNAEDLKIVGVVCAKEDANSTNLSPGIGYLKSLTEYVIEKASESEIVKKQMKNRDINVFSNKRFDDEKDEAGLNFEDMISIDTEMLSSAFGVNINEDDISGMTKGYMTEISSAISADNTAAKKVFTDTLANFATNMLDGYIEENMNETLGMAMIKASDIENIVSDYMKSDETKSALNQLESDYIIPASTFKDMYSEFLKGLLQAYVEMAPSVNPADPDAKPLPPDAVKATVETFISQEMIQNTAETLSTKMVEAVMQKTILTKVGELTGELMGTMATAFNVDEDKIAGAFQFDLGEEELMSLMKTMSASGVEDNADTNMLALGYQDIEKPSTISFYFKDFEAKENFIEFIDEYNEKMEKTDEEKVVKYTDLTGLLMSSVKTIVDSVSYVLIAFVSISLVVSSIMIGIITYISVFERTKEIGVLRAIGASKRNISSIFNAETFIVGLFAGVIGIGVSSALIIPINMIIHKVSGNTQINAVLPVEAATILVVLSVILTLIGGLIPSSKAAKKDPVLALRSE